MAHCWPYSRDDPVEELPGMRVFLAAYGAPEADLETSDLPGHTPRELTLAHQRLTTPGGGMSTRFPAAIELPSLGALSDALLGLRPTTSCARRH